MDGYDHRTRSNASEDGPGSDARNATHNGRPELTSVAIRLRAAKEDTLTGTVLGVDAGTSYIKVTVARQARSPRTYQDRSPTVLTHSYSPLISHHFDPDDWWERIVRLIKIAASADATGLRDAEALCVSGISPVLVLFDMAEPRHGVGLPYWHLPGIDGGTTGIARSRRRLAALADAIPKSGFRMPAVTDLVGYVNYRLTGVLTLNAFTAAELGFFTSTATDDYQVPHTTAFAIGASGDSCGTVSAAEIALRDGTDVCYGAPDSLTTALAAGVRGRDEHMLYLGTFGCLFRSLADLSRLTRQPMLDTAPYRWAMSVPGFGPAVEGYAHQWFPTGDIGNSLRSLDEVASREAPGAGGYFLALPIWDNVGRTAGDFRFIRPDHMVGMPTIQQQCRAVLESLAYAAHSSSQLPAMGSAIHVSGGGATSSSWLVVLATALDRVLSVASRQGTAFGSCILASELTGAGMLTPDTTAAVSPSESEKAATTRLAAAAWYSQR